MKKLPKKYENLLDRNLNNNEFCFFRGTTKYNDNVV